MVIIVGAGLAGLVCAGKLQENGINFVLIEKSSRLGGRVGSLIEGGVIFDMAFQVLIDSYPAARELLDLGRLEPQYFDSGAIIWDKGRFYGLMVRSDEEILSGTGDVPTKDYLRGFDEALERFFRPFFGGILLDNDLQTSSILFRYYYRKFVTGQAGRTRTLRHFVQLTNVAPDYISDDRHLISATALKAPLDAGDRARARSEILEMFPQAEADFTLVKVIEIPDAVPQQNPGRRFDQRVAKPFPNVWLSGDQVSHASIQGAMESGLATARDILEGQR